ncbi:SDR family oxidoreductase [Clavibacter sepedonicus]|uniref:SDR family oxidoreductase n=1 Tax=Clavibacter TaxID=1573 RepID=UPI0002E48CA6|nr:MULTISPECIES: SDR family NAD(P)-dependent oxidoreductase [Clavibacter]UUK64722.1 SDR family NAD(P)-dependent oxidoreductase [Clavibacter sepedonicus]
MNVARAAAWSFSTFARASRRMLRCSAMGLPVVEVGLKMCVHSHLRSPSTHRSSRRTSARQRIPLPLITIVGAGAGLGLGIARASGREGFAATLVSRDQAKLDSRAATLGGGGVTARGFAADIRDAASVTRALDAVVAALGPIDVLEFSPADTSLESVDVLEVTPANPQPQIDLYLGGALTAVGHVLPGMIEAGRGTVLVTTGGGSISPLPFLGNVNIAAPSRPRTCLCALARTGPRKHLWCWRTRLDPRPRIGVARCATTTGEPA